MVRKRDLKVLFPNQKVNLEGGAYETQKFIRRERRNGRERVKSGKRKDAGKIRRRNS